MVAQTLAGSTRWPRRARAKSFFFLAAALTCAASVGLWFSGDHERGLFVGLWVPSILSAGALLLVGEDDD